MLQERFDGEISRRLRVPEWVDADAVAAEYVDGVLTVRLPLAERAKPRRITVGGADQSAIAN
jgi:HSP20 family protein